MNKDPVKVCCADFYQRKAVQFFLGDSFHPGGVEHTRKLAEALGISASSLGLDIACGEGSSAIFLAETFGCRVTGTDAGEKGIVAAEKKQKSMDDKLKGKLSFHVADADRLPFPENSFDFAITECAFSTFSDKAACAGEIFRVLKPGALWGLSDMLIERERLPEEMHSLLFQAGCVADAENFEGYSKFMNKAGFKIIRQQDTSWALEGMIREVEKKFQGVRLLAHISNLPVSTEDLKSVELLVTQGKELLSQKVIGYGIVIGKK